MQKQTRRSFIAGAAGLPAVAQLAHAQNRAQPQALTAAQDAFLEDISHRSFQFFWEQSDPHTGVTRDKTGLDGALVEGSARDVGSTGATGFGVTALCIGAERGWISRDKARERVLNTLRFYADQAKDEHGWFYHFINVITGERNGTSEVSVSDATWLFAGALTAKQYFHEDPEIARLTMKIYQRVDYDWIRNGDPYLMSHGYRPETGLLTERYARYCQLALMYLLGIGAPSRPLPPDSWYAWERNPNSYAGYNYIGVSLLWTYQFPFAWADFRDRREARGVHADWWGNAITATRAHRQFCIDLKKEFPAYSENIWGITSSTSEHGYKAWGGPPSTKNIDGSVVPCAPAGSLMLTPDIALPALQAMKKQYGDRIYGRYGFTDAFNPNNGWVAPNVIGIDVGITLLSAENLRSGFVWKWFMKNPEIQRAMDLAGLVKK
jgi:hypothetical protein